MNKLQIEKNRAMFREMIVNEETLINRRLTWLIQVQTFLFAGIGAQYVVLGDSKQLRIVFALLGIIFSILILSALVANVIAFKNIARDWYEIAKEEYKGPDIFGFGPCFKEQENRKVYLSAENMIPIVFIFIWVLVMFFDVISIRYLMTLAWVLILIIVIGVLFSWRGKDI